MVKIVKKSYPPFSEHVAAGIKKFDVRLAKGMENVRAGDRIEFIETDPATRAPTGRKSEHKITYVMRTKGLDYWTPAEIAEHGLIVMQLDDAD